MKKIIIVIALLSGASANAQPLHGDLETWRDIPLATAPVTTLHAPMHWNVADSLVFSAQGYFTSAVFTQQVYQTTDAHSGSSAARVVTRKEDTLQVLPGLLTNADIALDFSAFFPGQPAVLLYSGGTPVSSRIPLVTAWVKYFPAGTDSAFVSVQAIKSGAAAGGADSVIGRGTTFITGMQNTYTQLTTLVTYTDATSVPDLLRVFIRSSGTDPQDSSTLYVDDINMPAPDAVETTRESAFAVYPVPAGNFISFHCNTSNAFTVVLYSPIGQFVATHTVHAGDRIDVTQLTAGIYYYTVNNGNGVIEKGNFIISK